MGRRRRRRKWAAAIAVGGTLAVVAALVPLVSYLAPRVLPNLFTEVAEAHSISSGGATATVTVPAGWASQRAWGSDSELVLRSPDGGFAATLTVSLHGPADTVGDDGGATLDRVAVEYLASGLEAVHAETADNLVVAVGNAASAPSLRIEVVGTPDEVAPYRPAMAELLETVRVSA